MLLKHHYTLIKAKNGRKGEYLDLLNKEGANLFSLIRHVWSFLVEVKMMYKNRSHGE